jgi:hypothetical protein
MVVTALGIFAIMSSGGGGGGGVDNDGDGGGDGNGDGNFATPQIYNFDLVNLPATPLAFKITIDGLPITIPLNELIVSGTYRINGQELTLTGMAVGASTGDELYGDLRIVRIEDIKLSGTNFPTQGAWEVDVGDVPILAIRVNNTGGVDIDPVDGNPVSYTWEQFMDISDNPEASDYEKLANASYGLGEMVLKRVWYFYQNFITVFSVMENLENAGSNNVGNTVSCTPFPPAGGTAGTVQYKYIDISSNGELSPGDDFQVIFNSSPNGCWNDDPNDDIDLLVKGAIQMNGYIENVENNQMTSTGFEEVLFDNFTETETENGVVTDDSITTNGGFNIFITTEY